MIIASCGVLFAQIEYPHGNAAYVSEAKFGYSDVIIGGGDFIYTYNHETNQYQYGNYILIPDLSEQPNGNYVSMHTFYGHGSMGNPSDTAFQWDGQSVLDNSPFDKINLFVSPISEFAMNYTQVLDVNQASCVTDDCYFTINPPDMSLAWTEYQPGPGNYEMWAGEELINAGDLKSTGTDSKHSQQQSGLAENPSFCVSEYGKGWRLPTDIEVGHFNDEEGIGNGFHTGYKGNSASKYIWTCSLFKTYTVKRWPVRLTDGYWENCAGFLYTSNYARCVFDVDALTVTDLVKVISEDDVLVYPNPASTVVTLQFKKFENLRLRILSVSQMPVKIIGKQHVQSLTLNVANFSPGIYFLEIKIENKPIICKKLIIKL
ncbi:MAG: T9SS type A sorting domain-containing protein [Bacteroidota bacterium]|nr:T9SS type A sorting domain-containing protein [Bacteroidota bacterium]